MFRAYHQAKGEWLVFSDADVRFAPDALREVMAVAKERGWEHVNILPHLELVGFWEKTVLSFWALSSIVWLEPWRVSDPHSRKYFGFGPYSLCGETPMKQLARTGAWRWKLLTM
jgi:hypothetical protein